MLSEVISSFSFLVWDLLKKRISNKINVVRPDDKKLEEYQGTSTKPINYAPDHILNNVR